jgi:hypothetical protein
MLVIPWALRSLQQRNEFGAVCYYLPWFLYGNALGVLQPQGAPMEIDLGQLQVLDHCFNTFQTPVTAVLGPLKSGVALAGHGRSE